MTAPQEPTGNRRGRRVVFRVVVLATVLLVGIVLGASVVRYKAPRVRTYAVTLTHGPSERNQAQSDLRNAQAPGADAEGDVIYMEPCPCTDPGVAPSSAERAVHRCPALAPSSDAAGDLHARFATKDGPLLLQSALRKSKARKGSRNSGHNNTDWRGEALLPFLRTTSRETEALPSIPGLATRRGYLSEAEQVGIVAELTSQGGFVGYFGKSCQEYGFNFSFYIAKPTAVAIPPTVRALAERMMRDGFLSREYPPNYVLVNRYGPGEGIHPHVDDAFYRGPIASVTLGAPGVLSFSMDEYGTFFHPPVGRRDIASGKPVSGDLRARREALLKERRATLPKCLAGAFPPGSFFAMTGEARYGWKHEMPRRSSDSIPVTVAGARVEGHEVGASAADLHQGEQLASLPESGRPLRTIVDRQPRLGLTFRHVRKEVVEARWAGKTFSSTAYT